MSAPCPAAPGVVVIKKPGGTEAVFDISGDFETVSAVDDDKYALALFSCHYYKYVAVTCLQVVFVVDISDMIRYDR